MKVMLKIYCTQDTLFYIFMLSVCSFCIYLLLYLRCTILGRNNGYLSSFKSCIIMKVQKHMVVYLPDGRIIVY